MADQTASNSPQIDESLFGPVSGPKTLPKTSVVAGEPKAEAPVKSKAAPVSKVDATLFGPPAGFKPAPEQPGIGSKIVGGLKSLGSTALNLVPGVGEAREAYSNGPTWQERTAVSLLDRATQPTGQSVNEYTQRRMAIFNSLKNHPITSALLAASIDLPIQWIEGIGANKISEKFVARFGLEQMRRKIAEGIASPLLEDALTKGQEAGQMAKRLELTKHAVAGATFAETDTARRKMMGEQIPASALLESPLIGATIGLGLGAVTGAVSDNLKRRMAPLVSDLVKRDANAKQLLESVSQIGKLTAKYANLPLANANQIVYHVLTGTADDAEQVLMRRTLIEHPELQRFPIGQHMLQQVHASIKPQVFADPSLKPTDESVIQYEDPTRNVHNVIVKDQNELKELLARAKRNEIRITAATGPTESMRTVGRITTRADVPQPTNLVVPDWTKLDQQISETPERTDKYFQGLPKVQQGSTELTVRPGDEPVRSPANLEARMKSHERQQAKAQAGIKEPPFPFQAPGGPAEAVGPKQDFIMRSPEGAASPAEQEARRTLALPQPQPEHPTEVFAREADALIGPLEKQGFKPVESGSAVQSHGHPYVKPNATSEQPVIIPLTQKKMVVSPNTGLVAGPHVEPKFTTFPLAVPFEEAPTGIPNDIAFPVRDGFINDLESFLNKPSKRTFVNKETGDRFPGSALDDLLENRTKGNNYKGFEAIAREAQRLNPDDPRLTHQTAHAAANILQTRIEDMARAAKAGKLDVNDPEALDMIDKLYRLQDKFPVPEGGLKEIWSGGPIRESVHSPAMGTIRVNNLGNGEISISTGALSGIVTKLPVKDNPSLAEVAKPLSDQDLQVGALGTGPKPLAHRSYAELRDRIAFVNQQIMTETLVPESEERTTRLADLSSQQARLTEAIRQRVGTPTMAYPPPASEVMAQATPPEEMSKDAIKAELAKLKKGIKGYSKGAIMGAERHPRYGVLETGQLGKYAKDLGHGRVFRDSRGRVTVEHMVDGRRLPVTYPDEIAAWAGLAHKANEEAAIASRDAEINRAIATDRMPPLARPNYKDSGIVGFVRGIGLNTPEGPEPRIRMASLDPTGIFTDGKAMLEAMGEDGRQGAFLLEAYLDFVQRGRGSGDAALSAYDRSVGKGKFDDVREFESGKGMPGAVHEHLRAVLNQDYEDAKQIGAPVAPLIEDQPGENYWPHRLPLSSAIREMGAKATKEFLEGMVHAGIADTPEDAWQKYLDSGGFVKLDRERTINEMVERHNARADAVGGTHISKAEASRTLDTYAAKAESLAPNLVKERKGNIEYDNSIRGSFRAVHMRNVRMIAERAVFGSKLERLNDIADRIRARHSKAEAEAFLALSDVIRGRNFMGATSKMESALDLAMSMDRTYLTMSPLRHITQNLFVAEQHGWGQFFKSMPRFIKEFATPEGRDAMRRAGAIIKHSYVDDSIEQQVLSERGPIEGKIMAATKKLGDIAAGPLEHSLNFFRGLASKVGEDAFDAHLKALAKGENPALLKELNEHMNRPGTTREEWLALKGRPLEFARQMAGMRTANKAFFRFDPLSLPTALSARSPLGLAMRIVLQFKSFLYSYTRFISHELMGADVSPARRARMWLTVLPGLSLYGFAYSKILEVVGAGNKGTANVVKKLHSAYKSDFAFKKSMDAVMAAMVVNHALGWFTGVQEAFYSGNEQGLLSLGGDLPAVSWLARIPLATGNAIAGAGNWAMGYRAKARYDSQKAMEQGLGAFGGPGTGLAHKLVGKPKKPSKGGGGSLM